MKIVNVHDDYFASTTLSLASCLARCTSQLAYNAVLMLPYNWWISKRGNSCRRSWGNGRGLTMCQSDRVAIHVNTLSETVPFSEAQRICEDILLS